jgi:hypothetical protein
MKSYSASTTYLPEVVTDDYTMRPKIRVHIFGQRGSDTLPIQPGDANPHESALRRAAHQRLGGPPGLVTPQREHKRGFIFTFIV